LGKIGEGLFARTLNLDALAINPHVKPRLGLQVALTYPSVFSGMRVATIMHHAHKGKPATPIKKRRIAMTWKWRLSVPATNSASELRIRPVAQRLAGALEKFGAFSADFMADGRGDNLEIEQNER